MLSRQHRFHGRSSLNFVYRHGSVVRGQHVALRYARNSRQTQYRLAVIVSRKVHKAAVARNRVRRRLYEIVRTGQPIDQPYDLVLTVYSDHVIDMPPAALTKLIAGLLTKARIYQSAPHKAQAVSHAIVKAHEDRK